MLQKKIENFLSKIHEIKNDITLPEISDFLSWFHEKIEVHFLKSTPKLRFQKWDIFFINLGKNIWSEINKIRPCVVYSTKNYNNMTGAIIIPFKSLKQKDIIEKVQTIVSRSVENWLEKDSILDIFYLRNISSKRMNKKIWKLEKRYLDEIDEKVGKMFGIKNKE